MFCEVSVSYVYGSPETWEKYDQACNELGWNKKTLLTQLLHSYGAKELAYYQRAAEMDALARGFSSHKGEHYRLLRDWGELPRYADSQPPFERSPLADIPDIPTGAAGRRSFRSIRCSGRNSAILHLATIVERSNIPQTLSRIMLWHFNRYWHPGYISQLEADSQLTINPEF
ncbi:hypothetical protein [Nodosilinea sp. AN01ver1]|uniref:hypothetical protein n=1 Tax=Nodosilinea sp. AN01ver1 TaxID=3423362 RepID=UPI003D316BC7